MIKKPDLLNVETNSLKLKVDRKILGSTHSDRRTLKLAVSLKEMK